MEGQQQGQVGAAPAAPAAQGHAGGQHAQHSDLKPIKWCIVNDATSCCCGCSLRDGMLILTAASLVWFLTFTWGSWYGWIVIAYVLFYVAHLFVSFIAFIGAYQYNRALVKVYIYWISFFIVLEIVLCIVGSALLSDLCDAFDISVPGVSTNFSSECLSWGIASLVIQTVIAVCLYTYFLWIAISFHNWMVANPNVKQTSMFWGSSHTVMVHQPAVVVQQQQVPGGYVQQPVHVQHVAIGHQYPNQNVVYVQQPMAPAPVMMQQVPNQTAGFHGTVATNAAPPSYAQQTGPNGGVHPQSQAVPQQASGHTQVSPPDGAKWS